MTHTAVPGRWQEVLPDGRLRCTLCPRGCCLGEGQKGFCFIRERRGDRIVLTSYGRASGFCIDPIEKKPLYHFHSGSSVLSFGTAGCNLGCRFCQNWDISRARDHQRVAHPCTPVEIAETAAAWGCRSVAFTYNDPVVFAEFAMDTANECRKRGILTVAVTAGYIAPEARREFYSTMDATNVDLKAFTDEFYRSLCAAKLDPVLDTLRYLVRETGLWLEITTLLIPGKNDGEDEVAALCDWVKSELGPEVPIHFTAFHPDYRMTDLPRTPAATCRRAREQALALGLRHVYTGNVDDPEGQTTFCARCGRALIERDGYRIADYQVLEGTCPSCKEPLAGRWSPNGPGGFGSRRIPVSIPSAPSSR